MPWSSFSECWALSQLFHSPLSLSSRGFLVPLHFLPRGWCHLLESRLPGEISITSDMQRYLGNSILLLFCCRSVTKLCLTLCNPMDCSTPDSPVLHISQSLLKFVSIESMMLSDHLNLCHPFLLLPSVFPSIGVFSNELALCIRWPEYWSFS